MHTNTARVTTRKATSVLHRLTMPHDERMLKSAVKTHSKAPSVVGMYANATGKRTGLSQTPYMNKGQDMTSNTQLSNPGGLSPELDRHLDAAAKHERS